MNGDYIAGFVDGEGSFHIAFQERKDLKYGWQAVPEFHVSQNFPSRNVLEAIRETLQCGYIKANDAAGKRDKTLVYVVRDRKDLSKKVLPFFEKYPLLSEKRKDFEAFRKIVQMMETNAHLTIEGFERIVQLAFSMNANGRYRKRKAETILAKIRILRDCTLGSRSFALRSKTAGEDTVRSSWRHEDLNRNIGASTEELMVDK